MEPVVGIVPLKPAARPRELEKARRGEALFDRLQEGFRTVARRGQCHGPGLPDAVGHSLERSHHGGPARGGIEFRQDHSEPFPNRQRLGVIGQDRLGRGRVHPGQSAGGSRSEFGVAQLPGEFPQFRRRLLQAEALSQFRGAGGYEAPPHAIEGPRARSSPKSSDGNKSSCW